MSDSLKTALNKVSREVFPVLGRRLNFFPRYSIESTMLIQLFIFFSVLTAYLLVI